MGRNNLFHYFIYYIVQRAHILNRIDVLYCHWVNIKLTHVHIEEATKKYRSKSILKISIISI